MGAERVSMWDRVNGYVGLYLGKKLAYFAFTRNGVGTIREHDNAFLKPMKQFAKGVANCVFVRERRVSLLDFLGAGFVHDALTLPVN